MKVIRNSDVTGTRREVRCPNGGFISFRYLLAKDGMGFGVHRTEIPKGEPQHWHYTKHLEACYCVSGTGWLVNLKTRERFYIKPGTLYALDDNDDHTFQALEPVVLISVFNPPVNGSEVHQPDGSYALQNS